MAKSPYAELPEPLKKQLPAMFASYPDLSEPHPSSWFAWTGNKVIAHNKAVCHAQMYYDEAGWDELITAVPHSDELSLEYLRMLIRGPFCSMSDLIKLDRVSKNYYLHCLSLNKWPANVLMNFCIASRVPIEFRYLLEPWAVRCEQGYNTTLAFLLTYSYGGKRTGGQWETRCFSMARGGHMWLDPASNWFNILHGTMESVSKPFKSHPQDAKPTNIIWGKCEDYKKLQEMTDEEISDMYTQPLKVFEPPPPPVFIPKYKKPELVGLHAPHFNYAIQVQQMQAFQHVANILAEPGQLVHVNNGDVIEAHPPAIQFVDDMPQPAAGHWGIQPADHPQQIEPFHEPEDEFVPDEPHQDDEW